MRMNNVAVPLLLICVASMASADLVDNFESYSQGAIANGSTVGPWYGVVTSGAAIDIVSSPISGGGNNAVRLTTGTGDHYVRMQAVNSFPVVNGDFKYSMDFNIASVSSDTSIFAEVLADNGYVTRVGAISQGGNAFTINVTDANGWFRSAGSTTLSTGVDYTLEITCDNLNTSAYDLAVKEKSSGNTVASISGAGASGSAYVNGIYIGNLLSGRTITVTADNVSLTNVPEPATMSLIAVGGLLLLKKRR